ncbi:MAG: hypothetical protein Q8K82_26210 [Gemmatimonadaceae bacterium]|nr:hypothetical protein [Gemmatimonadaceae bacterium]
MSPTSTRLEAPILRTVYPKTVIGVWVLIAAFVVADVVLGMKLVRYRAETARLRADMSDAERERADMEESSEGSKVSVMLELLRRRASGDPSLHLSVSVDSGTMLLERDGALLREMHVDVGSEKVVGVAPDTVRVVRPRGARTVQRVMGAREAWDVPSWVYAERGLPIPADRRIAGALGRNALMLSGGIVIYALPDSGILADSSFVLPGAIRLSRSDLRAISPNVTPGVTVYFYE